MKKWTQNTHYQYVQWVRYTNQTSEILSGMNFKKRESPVFLRDFPEMHHTELASYLFAAGSLRAMKRGGLMVQQKPTKDVSS